jgi:hypothetical protein
MSLESYRNQVDSGSGILIPADVFARKLRDKQFTQRFLSKLYKEEPAKESNAVSNRHVLGELSVLAAVSPYFLTQPLPSFPNVTEWAQTISFYGNLFLYNLTNFPYIYHR